MIKKNVWLFNFSSSYSGGGLRRLIETSKWFDENEGGIFIVHSQAFQYIKAFTKKNVYFEIVPNKVKRLFNDGYYLREILETIGTPEVYFSYGIPIFYRIGKVNWFHVSNALSLKTKDIHLPFLKRLQMILLKRRIIDAIKFTQIISTESEYSLNLLRRLNKDNNQRLFSAILPNGFDKNELINVSKNTGNESYAITVGTYKYKQLDKAFRIYHQLKSVNSNLKKFIVIGDKKDLSLKLTKNDEVVVDSCEDRKQLLGLLSNAEYYISASQIENSSIAALEGMILSKNIVVSDIPPHREMLTNINFKEIIEDNSRSKFLMASYEPGKNELGGLFAWNEATQKLYDTFKEYGESL